MKLGIVHRYPIRKNEPRSCEGAGIAPASGEARASCARRRDHCAHMKHLIRLQQTAMGKN